MSFTHFAATHPYAPLTATQVGSRAHVVETMVDRVCVSRTIEAGRTSTVDTVTEASAGRIVVLEPMKRKLVPFGGETEVVVPCDKDTARALYEHKFQTVNGLHGVLVGVLLTCVVVVVCTLIRHWPTLVIYPTYFRRNHT
jgi:hypothetical protein